MDCKAYCTASSYLIKPLQHSLREHYVTTLYRDVLHISVPIDGRQGDVFYFPYGSSVFWGIPSHQYKFFLDLIKEFEHRPVEEITYDEFVYQLGDNAQIIDDEVILPDSEVVTRLAFSHAMAQSVKLDTFETSLQKTFNHTKHLPEELSKYGRIGLSRKEIRRKMGELFIERSAINLHLDVLDTPEFFWNHSHLEGYYAMTANYLDIETRVEVMNQRLDVIHELFEVLGNELNHQHSSRLEWAIIWLIIIEVVLTLLRDVFRIL